VYITRVCARRVYSSLFAMAGDLVSINATAVRNRLFAYPQGAIYRNTLTFMGMGEPHDEKLVDYYQNVCKSKMSMFRDAVQNHSILIADMDLVKCKCEEAGNIVNEMVMYNADAKSDTERFGLLNARLATLLHIALTGEALVDVYQRAFGSHFDAFMRAIDTIIGLTSPHNAQKEPMIYDDVASAQALRFLRSHWFDASFQRPNRLLYAEIKHVLLNLDLIESGMRDSMMFMNSCVNAFVQAVHACANREEKNEVFAYWFETGGVKHTTATVAKYFGELVQRQKAATSEEECTAQEVPVAVAAAESLESPSPSVTECDA
jgi:hypothetical protein